MISAPNRLRLSNGNKSSRSKLLLLLLAVAFLSSCELFRKAQDHEDKIDPDKQIDEIQGPITIDPETGEYIAVTQLTEKMDTLKWKLVSMDRFPPITSDGVVPNVEPPLNDPLNPNYDPNAVGKISMLLPFFADRTTSLSTSVPENSRWALQYYAGVELALDELDKEGAKLDVSVFDTRGDESTLNQLLRYERRIQNADLIIGPYRSSNVQITADYAKQNQKTLISPYSANTNITSDNPYYVQVNPSLEAHCRAITEHVKERYTADQVVLVARNRPDELARFAYFQDANRELSSPLDTARFREFVVKDESVDYQLLDVAPYLLADRTTVFIVPSYRDESFIYSFLRKLKVATNEFSDVVVYGLPAWMDYGEIVNFDLFEDLHVHVSSFFYVDDYEPEIRDFRQRFYSEYGALPEEAAYIGYGVTRYFGRMLATYGPNFLNRLDTEEGKTLYTNYRFRKVTKPDPTGRIPEDFRRFDRYENDFVHILKFQDYYFQPAD